MLTMTPIPAFSDNYIWCLANSEDGKALIVDPGQADPVVDHLSQNHLTLDTILVTHHHPDHTGGIRQLASRYPDCRIVGPADSPFSGVTESVNAGDSVSWNGLNFDVYEVPGHTLDHIAFYSETEVGGHQILFCGDTLFVCGCGRLFEGSPAQMKQSLASLRQLPDTTAVYCAHEYTLANLKFARHWLPDDTDLAAFESRCKALRDKGEPTVPSTIGDEKRLNPFLRWDDRMVVSSAHRYAEHHQLQCNNETEVFAAVRHGKDHF
ncbi:hydroxyacylglutathione hydrolase [Marinobacter sp. CHS3-4]|uniref:hydroxyacylglutathione hydrolase n=1 Tax=Marinobacter sp. CHS3-4 TaxID=3045174 RepID=UPI0024B483C1|nr:hydroxyacylglutathione hydrolase [Marinobacter sp. CHS3-4]MDI9245479.1 hydroxyacylglutathione hydrolase [Marinobacter sp. CHS3-4]